MHTPEREPKLIVVTGGPCAGKTSFLDYVRQTEIGKDIVLVPEAATMVLPGFLAVREYVESGRASQWQYDLQMAVTSLQYRLEESHLRYARETGKRAVICDRGLRDAEAYTEGTEAIYKSVGLTAFSALQRYDSILHFESLASCAPELYSTADNQARYEGLEAALLVEQRTRLAWEGHPHRYIVPGGGMLQDRFETAESVLAERLSKGI